MIVASEEEIGARGTGGNGPDLASRVAVNGTVNVKGLVVKIQEVDLSNPNSKSSNNRRISRQMSSTKNREQEDQRERERVRS